MEEEKMCDITTRDPNAYLVVVNIGEDGSAKAKAFYEPNDDTRMPYPPSSSTEGSVLSDIQTGNITDAHSAEVTNTDSNIGKLSRPSSKSSILSDFTQDNRNQGNQGGQLKRRTRRRVTRNRKDRHRRHIRSRRTANKLTR